MKAADIVCSLVLGALASCGGATDGGVAGQGAGGAPQASPSGAPCTAPDARSQAVILDGVCRVITTLVDREMISHFTLDGGFVYWASSYAGEIKRTPVAGGERATLVSGLLDPIGVAVDGTHVFWTQFGPRSRMPLYDEGSVRRAAIEGGDVASDVIAEKQLAPVDVVTDRQHVYWSTSAAIHKAPKSGGPAITLALVRDPWGMVIDGDYLYWQTNHGGIDRISTSGGTASNLRGMPATHVLARDGTVFFSERKSIRRMPAEGSALAQSLVTDTYDIDQIATDGVHLYWGTHHRNADSTWGNGVIKRRALEGGPTETVVADLDVYADGYKKFFVQLALDATHLYFLYQVTRTAPASTA